MGWIEAMVYICKYTYETINPSLRKEKRFLCLSSLVTWKDKKYQHCRSKCANHNPPSVSFYICMSLACSEKAPAEKRQKTATSHSSSAATTTSTTSSYNNAPPHHSNSYNHHHHQGGAGYHQQSQYYGGDWNSYYANSGYGGYSQYPPQGYGGYTGYDYSGYY